MGKLKRCSGCKKELEASTKVFNRSSRAWDGLQTYCRICAKAKGTSYKRRSQRDPGMVCLRALADLISRGVIIPD